MKILSRYLLREHAWPFLYAAAALTGLMVLNQLARQFANLIGKGLPWGTIGAVFGLSLPFIMAMVIPMAVLVAVLHAFGRLAADSEITALKASGVNLARIVRPVLVAATAVALLEFAFVDQVLPRANHRLKNLLVDIARKKPTFELREQMVNEVVPGQLFLRAGRVDQAADRLRDVVIYDLADGVRRRTIYADSGYVHLNPDGTDLFLTLFDGYVHDYDRAQAGTFRRIFFTTDLVRVRGVSNRLERTGANDFRSDREMSLCEMEAVVAGDFRSMAQVEDDRRRIVERDVLALVGAAPPPSSGDTVVVARRSLTTMYCRLLSRVRRELVPAELRAEAMPPGRGAVGAAPAAQATPRAVQGDPGGDQLAAQLGALRSRRTTALQHAASYQVEIHKKYSLAVSCIVFVLIGAPVALRFPRGGVGLVIGASVVIFGFYYIGLIGGESLADRLVIPPFWAMWTPNVAMAVIGLVLFLRLGRERGTGRDSALAGFLLRRARKRGAAAGR